MNKIIDFYNRSCKIQTIEWICFDCFDTVLHRKLHPDNLKMMWAMQMCNRLSLIISPDILHQIRIETENSLMLEKGIIIKEYTYQELIQNLYNKLFFFHNMSMDFDSFYQVASALELELEGKYGYIDCETRDAIDYFLSRNIKIAIVSDTCLSGIQIRFLLEKYGIKGIDNIYVSSDYKEGKYSGKLYDVVISQLNVEPSSVLMIGDNKKSDISCAKAKGIRTFYKKWSKYPKADCYEMIAKKLVSLSKEKKKIAYENYAFALFYFIDKLYLRLKEDGVDKVLFLAREGEMLKALFDEYLIRKGDSSISSYYFHTSRISSFAACLRPLEEETFKGLFNKYSNLSIFTFLRSMGWKDTDIKLLENFTEFDFGKIIENFPESSEFKSLKNSLIFKQVYDRHREEQNKLLKKYLEQLTIDYSRGINIVDVGWRGSIQDNLFQCFRENVNIHGYYIGISKIWSNSDKNFKEGIVFSEYPLRTKNFEIWNFDKFMFERILLASHPTTIGYKNENDVVMPIFKEFLNEEEAYQYIQPYQKRVKELFIYISDLFQNVVYSAKDFEKIFTLIHLRMLCKIGNKEVKMQKRLYDYNHESFGEFGKTKASYFDEIIRAFKMNKIPIRKIICNGMNFKFIQSISVTTICVAHRGAWILPILYRMFYKAERKKIYSER